MFDEKNSLTSGLRNRPEPIDNAQRRNWIIGGGILIVLILLGLYIHSQIQISKLKKDLTQQQADPTAKTRAENQSLVDQVGKLIILPKGEEPTIATVNDLDKLKGQSFFDNAQLGDKVLIYTNAKKAILYRPTENKIIELAPLNDTTPTTNSNSALYNSAPATSTTTNVNP